MGAHLFNGASQNRGNVRVHPQLLSHVGAELAKESAIHEERGKAREGRRGARADARGKNNKKGDKDQGDDDDDGKG